MLFVLLLSWMAYYVVHSLLAAQAVKDRVARRFPRFMPWYRLFFNLVSILGIGGILLIPTHHAPLLWDNPLAVRYLGWGLAGAGAFMVLWVFRGYDSREFFGWPPTLEAASNGPLLTQGWHKWVRHPLYTGGIVFLLGYLLIAPTLGRAITVGCGLLYLYIGTLFEERKLMRTYGDAYTRYKARTPMLIPGWKRPD